MGKQGWLPVIESCRRITIRDVSVNGKMRDGYEWGSRFVWPSGFVVDAECRLDSHQPNLRKVRIKYQTGEYQEELEDIDEVFYLKARQSRSNKA